MMEYEHFLLFGGVCVATWLLVISFWPRMMLYVYKRAILVTGGAGYLGSVLSKMLLDAGHSVAVVDNLLYGQTSLFYLSTHPNFQFINGDGAERISLAAVADEQRNSAGDRRWGYVRSGQSLGRAIDIEGYGARSAADRSPITQKKGGRLFCRPSLFSRSAASKAKLNSRYVAELKAIRYVIPLRLLKWMERRTRSWKKGDKDSTNCLVLVARKSA